MPMSVATPSDSSWAMAAAARGLATRDVTAAILRCGRMNYRVILQVWPMSSVRSIRPMPNHIAHDSARSVSSSSSNCSLAARPEVLVVPQAGVVAGEAFRELGGDPLLRAVPGPRPPFGRVVVEVLVDAGRDALRVAGVLAHHAFVVERDHHPGQLADPHRQPVLVVDRSDEPGHPDSDVGGFRHPGGGVVVSERSDSAHAGIVRRAREKWNTF